MREEKGYASIAAIRTLYDDGHDMLDAVCSAVILVIEDTSTQEGIAEAYARDYLVEVPAEVLVTILKRLKKQGYVSYESLKGKKAEIKLTKSGSARKTKTETSVSDTRREFSDLIYDLQDFLKKTKVKTEEPPEKLLLSFIDENLGLTSSIISGDHKAKNTPTSPVASYIVEVEKSKPEKFEILQRIFFGRLYLDIIKTRTEYSRSVSFGELLVVLDTNVVFNVLGFHGEDAKRRAEELLKVLRRNDTIRVVVLDSTIDEAKRVLQTYEARKDEYFDQYKVDSLYQHLKARGIDKHTLSLWIEELSDRIESKDIEVVYLTNDIQNRAEADSKLQGEIETWSELVGNGKRENAILHDTVLITFVKHSRRKISSSLLEKSKAIIVSNDAGLKELSIETQKNNPSGVHMVWRPVELVSYLWIRDIGNEDIATAVIRQSMMAFARDKLINHNLWEKFINELKKAKKEERLSDSQIAYILAAEETKQLLVEKKDGAINTLVSDQYVNKLASEAGTLQKGFSEHESLKLRITKFAKSIASLTTGLLGLTIFIVATYIAYRFVSSIGIDTTLSIIGGTSIAIIGFGLLVFGKIPKASSYVLFLRKKFVGYLSVRIKEVIMNILGIQL